MNRATWTNGKRTVTGWWKWVWHRQVFVIQIDGNDDLGSRRKPIEVSGEEPEWGKWKLVETPRSAIDATT